MPEQTTLEESIANHQTLSTQDLIRSLLLHLATRPKSDTGKKKAYALYKPALARLYQEDQLDSLASIATAIQQRLGIPVKTVTNDIERHIAKSQGPTPPPVKLSSREVRIAMMDREILDVGGAARLLGVARGTIYRMARTGELPGTQVGREWRFARSVLIKWVENGAEIGRLLKKTKPKKR